MVSNSIELETKVKKTKMSRKNSNQWSIVFKALGNPYRLEMIKLLKKNGKMSVSALCKEIGISIKNTSRNLGILANLDILKSQGKSDHVYYEISPTLDKRIKVILAFLTH